MSERSRTMARSKVADLTIDEFKELIQEVVKAFGVVSQHLTLFSVLQSSVPSLTELGGVKKRFMDSFLIVKLI